MLDITPDAVRRAAQNRSRRPRRMPGIPAPLDKVVAPLRKLLAEKAAISVGLKANLAERNQLATGQHAASQADRQAMADALRAGSPEPPPMHEQERLAKLETVDRRLAGRRLALDTIDGEIEKLRRKAGADWAAAASPAMASARQAALNAVAVLETAMQSKSNLQDFADWAVAAPGQPFTPRLPGIGNSMNPIYPADAVRALWRHFEADPDGLPGAGARQRPNGTTPEEAVIPGLEPDDDDGD